jgi:hypothetical protein
VQLAGTFASLGDASNALVEGSAVLSDLQNITSPRTLNELRAVRAIAHEGKHKEFCMLFDRAAEKVTA